MLTIYDDAGPRVKMGLAFRFEKKDDKRIIIVDGFDKGSDPVLPYRIEGDKLVIESGKAVYVTPVIRGSVQLKGEWKRVKSSNSQAK